MRFIIAQIYPRIEKYVPIISVQDPIMIEINWMKSS
jgi:hypothetical protein